MNPFFTIVITTFNWYKELKRSIESNLAQSFENWELLVIDDGSEDDTPILMKEYCSKDSRIFYHHRPKTRIKGASTCKNIGIEKSKGELVTFFGFGLWMETQKAAKWFLFYK